MWYVRLYQMFLRGREDSRVSRVKVEKAHERPDPCLCSLSEDYGYCSSLVIGVVGELL